MENSTSYPEDRLDLPTERAESCNALLPSVVEKLRAGDTQGIAEMMKGMDYWQLSDFAWHCSQLKRKQLRVHSVRQIIAIGVLQHGVTPDQLTPDKPEVTIREFSKLEEMFLAEKELRLQTKTAQ